METRSARRRRLSNWEEGGSGRDHISELPDAVLHQILSLVPLKSVAQASAVSSRFRSLWSTLPDLDFSDFHNPNRNPADVIARTLDARDPKACNVRLLRFSATLSFSRLNGLFRTAVRHRVQELDVRVTTNDYFNFPRSVISCDSLRVLTLRSLYPGFRLPPPSLLRGGFRLLDSLSLSLMVFYHRPSLLDMFSDSDSACFPLLRRLSLEACFGLQHLRVRIPSLQDFTLQSCFQLRGLDVSGPNLHTLRIASCFDAYSTPSWVTIAAPALKTLVWTYNAITDEVRFHHLNSLHHASVGLLREHIHLDKLHTVSTLLLGISQANSLTLETQCIDVLSSNNYFACYLPPFNNINSLELQTAFRKHNGPGLANIFRSCPTLQTLTIKIINASKFGRRDWRRDIWERIVSEEEQFWETQIQPLKSFLLHLKIVRIHGFMECVNEVSLTQFLLKHGSALQELSLWTRNSNSRDSLRRQQIKTQIMAFSRASSDVKIQYH